MYSHRLLSLLTANADSDTQSLMLQTYSWHSPISSPNSSMQHNSVLSHQHHPQQTVQPTTCILMRQFTDLRLRQAPAPAHSYSARLALPCIAQTDGLQPRRSNGLSLCFATLSLKFSMMAVAGTRSGIETVQTGC